jgi:hypothetical protein
MRLSKLAGIDDIPDTSTWLFKDSLFTKYKKLPLKQRKSMSVAGWKATQAYSKEDNKKWYEAMLSDIGSYKSERRKQKLSPEEKAKIPEKGFAALKKISTEFKRSIKLDLAKNTLKSLYLYTQYIIIRFYSEVAFRNDLATVTLGDGGNNLSKQKGIYTIHMKDFKASEKIGNIDVKLSKALSRVITTYIKYRSKFDLKHKYLLVNSAGDNLSKKALGIILNKITKKYFGKSFGTRLIRIMKVRSEADAVEKAKKVANDMLHSLEQSQQYNKK